MTHCGSGQFLLKLPLLGSLLISVLSNESSGIYTESIWIEVKPYFTVEKCTLIIFDNEKIQKINLNREDTGFVDIQVIF